MDLANLLAIATDIAVAAGEIPKRHYNAPRQTDYKGSIDLVTEADRETEAFISDALKARTPEIGIVGEEGAAYTPESGQPDYYWFIDPIDGTTNFAHRLPHFSVVIALTDAELNPLVGVIIDPMRNELFTGYVGGGAFLNGQPLRVSDTTTLEKSLLATGFPYDRHTSPDNNLKEFAAMMLKIQGGRRLGSAALDLAYVAAGRFDGYWEQKLNRWDCLAGMVLVREAGGLVTDYDGSEAGLRAEKLKVIASNGHIHAAIQAVLADV